MIAISLDEGLVAVIGVVLSVLLILQVFLSLGDRRRRALSEEVQELKHKNHTLEAKLTAAEARPDMTKIAEFLVESRELSQGWVDKLETKMEHHEKRAEDRSQAQLRVLNQIAEGLKMQISNGKGGTHD